MKPKDKEAQKKAFAEFCETVAALRHPTDGCPWDLQQTHDSLRRYLIEEAYEAAHAMAEGNAAHICEELGDVLLQVVLNAQVGSDAGEFSIVDVIKGINEKMRRRHPHVFAKDLGIDTPEKVRTQWDEIKKQEKMQRGTNGSEPTFVKEHKVYPATTQAYAIGKRAKAINFDWSNPKDVLDKLESEVAELRRAFVDAGNGASHDVYMELGDLYFSLAQLCRHLNYDPETVALDGNKKFLDRFAIVEKLAAKQGKTVAELSQDKLEELWSLAKKS